MWIDEQFLYISQQTSRRIDWKGRNICHGLTGTNDFWSQGTEIRLIKQFPSISESYTDRIYLTQEGAFIVGIQSVVWLVGVS